MINLSRVITPEQRTREKGCAAVVLAACGIFVAIGVCAAIGYTFPTFGRVVGCMCIAGAWWLLGFETGKRFGRSHA